MKILLGIVKTLSSWLQLFTAVAFISIVSFLSSLGLLSILNLSPEKLKAINSSLENIWFVFKNLIDTNSDEILTKLMIIWLELVHILDIIAL